MKVKEIIKHLSKIPEDWEVDSIEFKDDKTRLQVSFDINSLCDKYYSGVKECSKEQEEDKAKPLDKATIDMIKNEHLKMLVKLKK